MNSRVEKALESAHENIKEWARRLDFGAEWEGDNCLYVVKEMREWLEAFTPIPEQEMTQTPANPAGQLFISGPDASQTEALRHLVEQAGGQVDVVDADQLLLFVVATRSAAGFADVTAQATGVDRPTAAQILRQVADQFDIAAGVDVGRQALAEALAAGLDVDQADDVVTTRNQVDPWAEIHHPDKHQPAAVQPAGAPANLYLCQCGQAHQRPEPPAQPTEPTEPHHLSQLAELGWAWNEIPTAYIGMPESEAETVEWLKRGDDGSDPGPRPPRRMVCWHCQSAVVASETSSIPSCTNVECPGKLDFLREIRAQGDVGRGSN